MENKLVLKTSLLFALVVGLLGSIYDPNLRIVKASLDKPLQTAIYVESSEYWRGSVDKELSHIGEQLKGLNVKLENLCNDMTNMKIKSAESYAFYGGASGMISFLIGSFIKFLLDKRNKK